MDDCSLSHAKRHKLAVSVFRAYCSPIIAIIGILGNILVFFVFITDPRRSRFTIYCCALSLMDLLALTFNSLMDDFLGKGLERISSYSIKFDVLSDGMCKFMEYVPVMAYFSSSYIMLCFTIDRTLTIYSPMKFFSEYYRHVALYACIGICLVSTLANLPTAIVFTLTNSTRDYRLECALNSTSPLSQFTINFKAFCIYTIPNVLILILSVAICAKLCVIRKARAKLLMNSNDNHMEMSRVIGHLVLSVTFMSLSLPLAIIMLIRINSNNLNYWKPFKNCLSIIESLSKLFSSIKDVNYMVNFFLYVIFMSSFRWRLMDAVCGCCRKMDYFNRLVSGSNIDKGIIRYNNVYARRKSTRGGQSSVSNLAHLTAASFNNGMQVSRGLSQHVGLAGMIESPHCHPYKSQVLPLL